MVFPPLNLLALQSNIHGTSSLVQAVWAGAVPKSLGSWGLWSDEFCAQHKGLEAGPECGPSHAGGDLAHKDCTAQAQHNENQTNASSGSQWELLTPPLQHDIKNSLIRFLSR